MSSALRAVLDRQRQSFLDNGPPGVTARRNRIDRLMALVLDNTDAFVEAMSADFAPQWWSCKQRFCRTNDFVDSPVRRVGRSGMGAYHGKASFDALSHYRTVVGSDLPFSLTGTAAPPFRRGMRLYADVVLSRARNRATASPRSPVRAPTGSRPCRPGCVG